LRTQISASGAPQRW